MTAPYTDNAGFSTFANANKLERGFPPVGMVGAIFLMTQGGPISNRLVYAINPYSTDPACCKDWKEFNRRRVSPVVEWLEKTKDPTSGLIQFDRVGGSVDDYRRFWTPDEMQRAKETAPWLVHGFFDVVSEYVRGGRQVVQHMGGPDAAHFAKDIINAGDQYDLLEQIGEWYWSTARAGAVIGLDGASGESATSVSYGIATLFDCCRIPYQIESTPPLKAAWWKGKTCQIAWPTFSDRHVNQQPWAVGKWAKFPSKDFSDWHPDCRVSLYPAHFKDGEARLGRGTADDQRAVLAEIQAVSKQLTAGGVRVLLHEDVIQACLKLGVGVQEFIDAK